MAALTEEQRRVLNTFVAEARRQGATPKEVKALVEAGLVESGLRNLNYGDRDSLGALQQRPSQGWRNALTPSLAARDFLTRARGANQQGMSAGQLAQAVQRSAFPGRYDERGGEAAALLGGATEAQAASTRTTHTTPGVDRSAQRGALIAQFLTEKNANPVDLALGVRQLRDTPGRTVTGATTSPAATGGLPKGKRPLLELFWQGKGGIDVKNGQVVPQGFVSGHQDHVHVATGPNTVVALGQLAQRMGLHVGENTHFDPSFNPAAHSGHAPNSYHYKNQAIDVSGPPDAMAAFARRVARMYGIK